MTYNFNLMKYTENYNQSNNFLFCLRRPRPWFRRYQERM